MIRPFCVCLISLFYYFLLLSFLSFSFFPLSLFTLVASKQSFVCILYSSLLNKSCPLVFPAPFTLLILHDSLIDSTSLEKNERKKENITIFIPKIAVATIPKQTTRFLLHTKQQHNNNPINLRSTKINIQKTDLIKNALHQGSSCRFRSLCACCLCC